MSVADVIKKLQEKDAGHNAKWYANIPAGVPPPTTGWIDYDDGKFTFHPTMIELTEEQVNTTHRVPVPSRPEYWDEEDRVKWNKPIAAFSKGKINEWLYAPGGLVPRVLAKRHPSGLGGRSRRKSLRRTRRNK